MNSIVSFIEWAFWGCWFAVLALVGLANMHPGASARSMAILAGVAAALGVVGWVLKNRPTAKLFFNFGLAVLWLLFYFLIGFPNTILPSGERALWAVVLLILISILPALILGAAHLYKKR